MSSNPKSSTSTCWKKSWHSKECRKFLDLRCAVAASALEHEVSPSGRGVDMRWGPGFGQIFLGRFFGIGHENTTVSVSSKRYVLGILICQQILSWNNKDVRCKRIYRTSCWLHSPYNTQSFVVYVESHGVSIWMRVLESSSGHWLIASSYPCHLWRLQGSLSVATATCIISMIIKVGCSAWQSPAGFFLCWWVKRVWTFTLTQIVCLWTFTYQCVYIYIYTLYVYMNLLVLV